ncbi:Menaquinone-specific isochorismate synthase [Candidatus Providencia siddallii]|uniref:isochorismate synthase n=1 Tax=Candidatus Providencia siddallii TaxID=1715285 RepID=A0A0M6W7Y2_9GAMM|nr:Menaquinone-specific isochorismate synthase [Candidatus Providencia siddallii]
MTSESFYKLINEIIKYLYKLKIQTNEYICIIRYLNKGILFSWLSWLSKQIFYPQFYWYHRNGIEESSVLGIVNSFKSIIDAEFFLLQHSECSNLRIWVLNGWNDMNEYESGFFKHSSKIFFIPRLEIFRIHSSITFSLNINGKKDISEAIVFLQNLKFSFDFSEKLFVNIVTEEYFPNYNEWCYLLTKAIREINSGNIRKVVIARETKLILSNAISVSNFLLASQKVNYYCYHFMIAFSKNSGFISSTPERLYLRKNLQLFSEALAGTVVNDIDEVIAYERLKWLIKDKKNQYENLIVVNDICQQLKKISSNIFISKTKVVRLRDVQHLCRFINATLIKPSDSKCLSCLYPTAAICGSPRVPARNFLLKNEPFHRNWYGGIIGFISLSTSEFAIAIRCAQVNGSKVSLYSGAGIVNYSDPYQEWVEIENKIVCLKSLFDITM